MATGFPAATFFSVLERRSSSALLWATVVVPIVLLDPFYYPFISTRSLVFRGLVELALGVGLIAVIRARPRLKLARDPIFFALLAFLIVAGMSAALSPAPIRSFYGEFQRMGGVWAWLHWLLYYALLRIVFDERDWTIFFRAVAVVSLVVSLLGFREMWSAGVSAEAMTSTVGNSGLLAGYLILGLAFVAILLLRRDKYIVWWMVIGVLDALALLLAQNRSSMLGIALGCVAGVLCYRIVARTELSKRVLYSSLAVLVVLGALFVVIRVSPTSGIARMAPAALRRAAATSAGGTDEDRLFQWKAALEGFKADPVLGIGPGNYNLVWSRNFDPAILRFDPAGVYDRVHNEYLEILATTGLLGFCAFAGIWLAVAATLIDARRNERLTAAEFSLLVGAQIAYGVYLFFWFTDVNATTFWIALIAFIAAETGRAPLVGPIEAPVNRAARRAAVLPAIALAGILFSLYVHVLAPLQVSNALTVPARREVPLRRALEAYGRALDSPAPQKSAGVALFGSYFGTLRPQFSLIRRQPRDAALMDATIQKAIAVGGVETTRDPLNDNVLTDFGRLLFFAGDYYRNPGYSRAGLEALRRAIELSPRKPSTRAILATMFSALGDHQDAIATARAAVAIDTTYGQSHYYLARTYVEAGKFDSAVTELGKSAELRYGGDVTPYIESGGWLEQRGDDARAATLYRNYLEVKYGSSIWTGQGATAAPTPTDIRVAAHLPLVYLKLNDLAAAASAAAAFATLDPGWKTASQRFDSSLAADSGRQWRGKLSLLPFANGR